jgi:hypothetical protein
VTQSFNLRCHSPNVFGNRLGSDYLVKPNESNDFWVKMIDVQKFNNWNTYYTQNHSRMRSERGQSDHSEVSNRSDVSGNHNVNWVGN